MHEQGMEKWEKHAKETIEKLKNAQPTMENARILADSFIILAGNELMEMFDMKSEKRDMENRMYNRDYGNRDMYNRDYDGMYEDRRYRRR